ncbi:ribosome maturation factor RimM [Spongiactinospora gelatinilytica]|uniref:Ribosome maturation factor RimM n=1 Tax=Spongiactinospora gelatinilytica TaxID=2666298 RepID=A0A2W2J1K8_9ACTN|nr:ribosome maturation factor RimM [Spongiactinospora gelatinilytica]PZG55474.1 ribosome maturation factor RimM [Spongiactinospora gelatinilytica]
MQLVVGRIGRPHGVRGEVSVDVRTDDPALRFVPGASLATDPASAGPLVIEQVRPHSGFLLVRFAGVHDRDAAGELRGVLLLVESDDSPPLDDPDEFYDHQLIGLSVAAPGAEPVGRVADVLHHGQDLLVVRRTDGREVYVPFVRALVPEIDLEAGLLVVDAPPGLLDPDESV